MTYFNSRSILPKLDEFHADLFENPQTIFCITETWLTENTPDLSLNVFGSHNFFRVDRLHSRGGGVLICIPISINCFTVPDHCFSTEHFDIITVCILGKEKIFLSCCYRRPNYSVTNELIEVFKKICFKNNSIIIGDFNLPSLDWSEYSDVTKIPTNYLDFYNTAISNGLYQLVKHPTRGEHYLDLLFTNMPSNINNIVVTDPFGTLTNSSDHLTIKLQIKTHKNPKYSNSNPRHLNFKKAEHSKIAEYLFNINWDIEFEFCSSSIDMYAKFMEHYNYITLNFVPYYKPRPIKLKLSRKTLKHYSISKRLRTKASASGRLVDKFAAKCAARAFRNCKRKDLLEFDLNNLKNYGSNKFWSFIKSKTNKSSSHFPSLKSVDGILLQTDSDICNALSSHFQRSFNHNTYNNFTQSINVQNSFRKLDLNYNNVLSYLRKIKPSLSSGVNNLPYYFLHKYAEFLCYPLSKIYNVVIGTGIIPSDWLSATITPINKVPNPGCIDQFRPISIICSDIKILELIIRDRIVDYFRMNNIISQCQFGFVKRKSVEGQLLCYTDFLSRNIDNNIPVDVFYTDFTKAFDKIPHNLLLHKLKNYGIDGYILQFISAWLNNRKQRVKYGKSLSNFVNVCSGVPQGTVLGPLLFIIFINDIFDVINCKSLFYADDGKFFTSINSIHDCISFNNDMFNIQQWCVDNGMSLSLNKCSILHIGSNNPHYKYSINGTSFQTVETIRDLGVTIDSELNFDQHIRSTVHRASVRLNNIMKLFFHHEPSLKIMLYKVFVRPLLEYCTSVWFPKTKGQVKLIESVQRKFTRFYCGCKKLESPSYDNRLKSSGLVSLSRRRLVSDLCLLYKIIHRDCLMLQDFPILKFSARKSRGHPFTLDYDFCKTTLRSNYFSIRNVRFWNSLPMCIVTSKNAKYFRIQLNQYLDANKDDLNI